MKLISGFWWCVLKSLETSKKLVTKRIRAMAEATNVFQVSVQWICAKGKTLSEFFYVSVQSNCWFKHKLFSEFKSPRRRRNKSFCLFFYRLLVNCMPHTVKYRQTCTKWYRNKFLVLKSSFFFIFLAIKTNFILNSVKKLVY